MAPDVQPGQQQGDRLQGRTEVERRSDAPVAARQMRHHRQQRRAPWQWQTACQSYWCAPWAAHTACPQSVHQSFLCPCPLRAVELFRLNRRPSIAVSAQHQPSTAASCQPAAPQRHVKAVNAGAAVHGVPISRSTSRQSRATKATPPAQRMRSRNRACSGRRRSASKVMVIYSSVVCAVGALVHSAGVESDSTAGAARRVCKILCKRTIHCRRKPACP